MNEIIFDIETQNLFGPSRDTRELKVSVVGVYDYSEDKFLVYEEKDLPFLFTKLEQSIRIIGYNIKGFDLPVLNNYYRGNLLKLPSLDLMEQAHAFLGFRPRLDDLAKSTLNIKKSADGLQAVKFWNEGRMQELKDYCIQDVRVTRELYEFGKKHGFVKLCDKFTGRIKEVPVNFSPPKIQAQAKNLSLF